MPTHPYRRHPRLTGVASLFDLALPAWSPTSARPRLPTSARLRRDVGMPEIDEVHAPAGIPHRTL